MILAETSCLDLSIILQINKQLKINCMKMNDSASLKMVAPFLFYSFLFATLLLSSCSDDDPTPTNEEEVITTLVVDLTPAGGSGASAVQLKFYDADGDGSTAPVVTPTVGQLKAGVTYTAAITLFNETESPVGNITEEIEEEKNAHLLCFTATGTDVTVSYLDKDDNNLPIGLSSSWVAGSAGSAGTIRVALRHQPGVKNGECPGPGESDMDVTFPLQVIN
jgi:hypothetical protein